MGWWWGWRVGGAALLIGLTAPIPAYADSGEHYVSLGDSYTSGPLIPNPTGHPLACLRSDHNYPSLIADKLGVASFTDASCAGASTDDMTASQNLGLEHNAPQFDALKSDTTLVTLGIGGNDINFASIVLTCGTLSATDPQGDPCEKEYTEGGTDRLAAKIEETGPKITKTLDGIRERSPHARVIVVGYPRILPASGPGCWPVVPGGRGGEAERHAGAARARRGRGVRRELRHRPRPVPAARGQVGRRHHSDHAGRAHSPQRERHEGDRRRGRGRHSRRV